MKEIKASIWDSEFDSFWRVIPINCQIKTNGCLVMGGGKNSVAQQAAERYTRLSHWWGHEMRDKLDAETRLRKFTNTPETCEHLFIGLLYYPAENHKLVGFPTKYHWKDKSSLRLIDNHLDCLADVKRCRKAIDLDTKIVSPRLGCGLGGLNWGRDVKPLVEKYFGDDDNFVVVNL